MSVSPRMCVTYGLPVPWSARAIAMISSVFAYRPGAYTSPVEIPAAPCASASSASRTIARSSSEDGARSENPRTAARMLPCPTSGARFTYVPTPPIAARYAARSDHVRAFAPKSEPMRSATCPPFGNGLNPQLPQTSVVTPWRSSAVRTSSCSSGRNAATSPWVWVSMKPGATT